MRQLYLPASRIFQTLCIALFLCLVVGSGDGAGPQQSRTSGPKIWLADTPQRLRVTHVAARPSAQFAAMSLATGQGTPVAMTHGDFDADGVEDLAVGYATPVGGAIVVHRGNLDAFAPQSQASFEAIGRGEFPPSFLSKALVFDVPVRPDFLAVGDFTGHGRLDLVVANQGLNVIYILPGDGKGRFGAPQPVGLTGGVTALAAGTFGVHGRLTNLVVGISAGTKANSLLVLGETGLGLGVLSSHPLPGAVSNIEFGEFGGPGTDVAFLSGGNLQILRSANLQVTSVSLPISVRAFALGSFIYDRNGGSQIAALASDGSVHIVVRDEFDPRMYTNEEFRAIRQAKLTNQPLPSFYPVTAFRSNGWKIEETFPGVASLGSGQAPVIFRTRISVHAADDVMVLNGSGQMALISHAGSQPGAQTFLPGQVSLRPYNGTPTMALPLRTNADVRPGVIALHKGEIAPTLIHPIPDPTFTVNTTNDGVFPGACAANTANECTLREAILEADGDTIMVPAGTYTLTIAKVANDCTGKFGALSIGGSPSGGDGKTVTIMGAAQTSTIIQAGTVAYNQGTANGVDMVMNVNEDLGTTSCPITSASASLSNLTLQNGHNRGTHGNDGDGGCMEFDTGTNGTANLSLTNVTLQNCDTTQGNGAGLANFNFEVSTGTGQVTFSNSIVEGNSAVDSTANVGAGGGGIWVSQDSSMTMTASQVLNNKATEVNGTGLGIGGGIFTFSNTANSRQTAIHSSTISGNESVGFGGGIWNSVNLLVDQGTVISGNTAGINGSSTIAGQQGGGIYTNTSNNGCPTACTDSVTLNTVTITGNTATGPGGGIWIGNDTGAGPLNMQFSRLAGNTASVGTNLDSDNAAVTATDDWWGTNSPSTTIHNTAGTAPTFDPFIVLTHTSSPQTIKINQSTTLTGDMSGDNHGTSITLGDLSQIVGLPITFGPAVLGSIPQAQPETLGTTAQATATFNAGGTEGQGTANATVDQAVVPVNSNLIASASESGTTVTITTVGAHGYAPGEFVSITGVSTGFDGQFFPITSTPSAITFTYTASAPGLSTVTNSGTADAGIYILQPPSITMSFNPTTVAENTSSTITFSVTNGNVVPIDGSFTDSLPTNLVVATPNGAVNNCGGTVTATAGSGSISFSNSSLAAGTCSIQVNVQSAVDNNYSNSVTIDSTAAGNGNTSTASLTVINPPSISKAFGATTIPLNGTTSLTFTLSTSNANLTLNGVAFTDSLPTGLAVATPNGLVNNCAGTASATAGGTSISLTGASLAPGATCTVSANVQGIAGGQQVNTVAASSANGGTSGLSTASITVVAPPSIAKAFSPNSIPLNGTSTLTFTISNPSANTVAEAGVAFSDTLPTGLVVGTPNGLTNSCSGTASATAGGTSISLSGGSIAAGSSCAVAVNVLGTAAGSFTNTSGAVSSTDGGTGNTASAPLTVVAPPSIAKAFNPTTIPANGTSSLTFTITNPAANTVAEAGVAFTDTLPTGLVVATPNGLTDSCGGTPSATAGGTSISLTGGSIAVNTSCTVVANVTGTASGAFTNTSGAVSSTNGGTGNTATANLTVASPPSIAKAFGATSIPLNGTTMLNFSISNPNTIGLTGVAFTDTLPSGLVVASTPNLSNSCNGTATAVAGSSTVSLSGGTIAAGGSCPVFVNVTGTTAGVKNNSTTNVTSNEGGTGNTANASITVLSPPTISKSFGATSIPLNGSTSLSFTISNPNTGNGLSGIGFSDTLPSGLVISTPNGLTSSCSGTITATQGTGAINLSGATEAASGSCAFSVNVTGTAAGQQNNTTGAVTSTEGGTGGTASASITVVAPPSISKVFAPTSIPLNGTSTLTFAVTNPSANTVAEAGVAFSDTLPTGLVVATPNGLTDSCGGTAAAGGTSISLTGGNIAVGNLCTVAVNVTGNSAGTFTNTSGAVSSTNGGTGNTATANLKVASPPSIAKAFGATSVPLNGTTTLNFSISNPNTIGLTGIAFTDNLPSGLVVASTPNLSNTCNGTATAVAGNSTVSLSGGTDAASGSCAVSLNVTGTTAGVKNNSTNSVTSNEGGTGNFATASITVLSPPTISKSFGATSIPLNGSTSLSFTISNPNTGNGLSGVGFSDTLPSGLVVSTPNGLTSSCSGAITATQGTGVISLSGATEAASGSCMFNVNVTGTTAGTKVNTTGNVTSNEGGTGGMATATIHVEAPPSIAKAFNPSTIAPNGVSTLTFTVTDPAANPDPEAGVAFSDTLPANLVVATPNGAVNNCGGTLSAVAGSGSLSLTGGSVAVASSCTVSVNLTSAVAGTYNNLSGAVSSTNGGTGNTAAATLKVAHASLTITKSHIGMFDRGSSGDKYTITVSNSTNAGPTIGTVTVKDTLPNVSHTLVPTAISGTGWTCALSNLTCTRSDALAPGASYPPITLTVSTPKNVSGGTITNSATVSGGEDPNSHTAHDPTQIFPPE